MALCLSFVCSSYCLDQFRRFDFGPVIKNCEVQAFFSVSFGQKLETITIENIWQNAIKDISGNEEGKKLIERLCILLSVFGKIEDIKKDQH